MSCFIIFFLFVLVLHRVMGSCRDGSLLPCNTEQLVVILNFVYGCFRRRMPRPGGGAVTPYNGPYGEAPPERDTLSGFRYMKG